jgi:hypothetical protein
MKNIDVKTFSMLVKKISMYNTGCLKIIVFRVRGLVGDILLKNNCCHFEKNIKVANICSKVPD